MLNAHVDSKDGHLLGCGVSPWMREPGQRDSVAVDSRHSKAWCFQVPFGKENLSRVTCTNAFNNLNVVIKF